MNEQTRQTLASRLLAQADDELILAQRDAEWTGHAPILEEDIAFANIAQDELGHAMIWYGLYQGLTGRNPDQVVFFREAADFRNVQLVELPKGDWAFTLVRQYLFDAAEILFLDSLSRSTYQPLAEAAAKLQREEIYHYRHTSAWVRRLGLGTDESKRRTQRALDELWPYAGQLFEPCAGDENLVSQAIIPSVTTLKQDWEARVRPFLQDADLEIPTDVSGGLADRSQHTAHLAPLLAEMQKVARSDPEAIW